MPESKCLLWGLDTVECAYYVDVANAAKFDFDALMRAREAARYEGDGEPRAIILGDTEFFLWPYGTRSGYSIILTNRLMRIECSAGMSPSFFVKFTSEGLWSVGLRELDSRLGNWMRSLGLVEFQAPRLSRVDFSFDYRIPSVDFDEDSFVSRSQKDSVHRKNGEPQTFTFGKGDVVLRVYDKVAEIHEASKKTWFFDLWGRDSGSLAN